MTLTERVAPGRGPPTGAECLSRSRVWPSGVHGVPALIDAHAWGKAWRQDPRRFR